MKRIVFGLLALLAAGPAMAQDVQPTPTEVRFIGLFDRFCLSNGGRMAAALAAADAEGWVPTTPSFLEPTPGAPVMAGRMSHALVPGGPQPVVLVMSSSPEGPGQVHVCSVDAHNMETVRLNAVVEMLADRLGIEPVRPRSGPSAAMWVFSGTGPFADETRLMAGNPGLEVLSTQERPIYMLSVQMDGPQPAILYFRVGD